eukprot:419366-Prymnesium_polylepis.1
MPISTEKPSNPPVEESVGQREALRLRGRRLPVPRGLRILDSPPPTRRAGSCPPQVGGGELRMLREGRKPVRRELLQRRFLREMVEDGEVAQRWQWPRGAALGGPQLTQQREVVQQRHGEVDWPVLQLGGLGADVLAHLE